MATSDTSRRTGSAGTTSKGTASRGTASTGRLPGAPSQPLPRQRHPHLPADAREHPREAGLAVVVLVLGAAAVVCGLVDGWHLAGSVTGLAGVLLGFYDQYLSATRAERMVIIPGLVLAGLGLGLSLAHGGFAI
ncbi:MAG: hypothetical protein ACTHQ3_08350 [Motilibacteraceae bacterium]